MTVDLFPLISIDSKCLKFICNKGLQLKAVCHKRVRYNLPKQFVRFNYLNCLN